MSIRKFAKASSVTLIALGLMGLVAYLALSEGSISTVELSTLARQQRDAVLDQVGQGKILHLRFEVYTKYDPSRISDPNSSWVGPEYKLEEVWMGGGVDGQPSTYVATSRNLQGELLSLTQLSGDGLVSTWKPTGEQIVVDSEAGSVDAWVRGMWELPSRQLAKGWSLVDHGQLNSRSSSIFEVQYNPSTDLTAEQMAALGDFADPPEQPDRVQSVEFAEDMPLIWKSSIWILDENGTRTLTSERIVLEYELLDADTVIGPFE